MKKTLLTMLILCLLTACSGNAAAGLTSSTWALVSMPGYDRLPATPTMKFDSDSGSLSGSSGCNHYSTAYKVTGNQIKLDAAIAATLMGCETPQMNLEQAFLSQLATVSIFELSGDQLILQVDGGEMVFQAAE